MITRRDFVKATAAIGAGAITGCAISQRGASQDARPNIVMILADDLGFECLGAYGGQSYNTVNIDRLARSGMKFKYCFGTPVCSPARAELLTGRYNFRSGFIDIAGRSGAVEGLDPTKEITLANLLQAAGYATAVTGKWHLGWGNKPTTGPAEFDPQQYRPSNNIRACGFEQQYCFSGPHISYGEPIKGQYHPDLYHDWALKYLDSQRSQTRPFFLYYALGLPHFEFDPTPLNPQGKKKDKANFPYMVQYLDQQVGQIVRKLDELGMRQNTLIVFTGDNGTDQFKSKLNGREVTGGKSSLKDTGAWVPLMASWPGTIRAASQCDDLTDFTDFLPTLCEIGGAKPPTDRSIDGHSFAPQLRGRQGNAREWVYVQMVNKWFIRDKKYKLRETGRLYDLSNSPFQEPRIEPKDETPDAKAAKQKLAGILVAMLAAEGASKRPAANAKTSAKATVEKAELELRLPLVTAKNDPVLAELILRNKGKKPLTSGPLRLSLHDSIGQRLSEKTAGEQKPIEPGKELRLRVNLPQELALQKIGTYSITCECDVDGEEMKGQKKLVVERSAFIVSAS